MLSMRAALAMDLVDSWMMAYWSGPGAALANADDILMAELESE